VPSFNKILNPDKENLLIVDGLNFAFRFKRAKKKVFASEYIQTIHSFAKSYKAKRVVILGDAGSAWRKGIYPEYKANRAVLIAKQTEEEREDFESFINEFSNTFNLCSKVFTTFRFDGCEADDIAAYISRECYRKYKHVWMVSSDKDWDLLVNKNVSRFSYLTRKETTVATWDSIHGFPIHMAVSMKVLSGDKGDNVPKPVGLGEKRAHTILREYGSALNVYDSLPIDDTKKHIQNLNQFGDQLLLNYQLVDLLSYCDDALGSENIEIIERIMRDGQ